MSRQGTASFEPAQRTFETIATSTGITAMNMPASGAPARRMQIVSRQ